MQTLFCPSWEEWIKNWMNSWWEDSRLDGLLLLCGLVGGNCSRKHICRLEFEYRNRRNVSSHARHLRHYSPEAAWREAAHDAAQLMIQKWMRWKRKGCVWGWASESQNIVGILDILGILGAPSIETTPTMWLLHILFIFFYLVITYSPVLG